MRRTLTVSLLVLALLALPAAAAQAKPHGLPDPKACNGLKTLCKRTLDQVVLPGSHNAMSSANLGWKLPNQILTIPEQLDFGIRAFLMDTHYGRLQENGVVVTDDDGEIQTGVRGVYLCHELCELGASPLAPVLRQVRKWLRANPAEVLVIENEDYISNADFVGAMEKSGLLDYVYRGPDAPFKTLGQMITKGHRVVMLADNDKTVDPLWYRPTYEGLVQETPYTFNPPSKLTDPANWPVSCEPNRGLNDGTLGTLFLMNHWSPSIAPLEPNPTSSAEVNATDVIVGRAAKCAEIRGRYPNMIAVDQVGYGGIMEAVARLNKLPASIIRPPGS